LFLAYEALNTSDDTRNDRIVIDRETLLTYLQYQAKAFDRERFDARLNNMSSADRQRLIDGYVRDETLYREAKVLQLDKNDSVARMRLIQQMRYLTQSVVSADRSIGEGELQDFYREHSRRYIEPAKATFTHVFFSSDKRSAESAESLAREELAVLNRDKVPFHRATAFGERFLYHRNYVNKEDDLVASHFGEALQAAVFALPANDSKWLGPYESPYGFHLVLLTQVSQSYTPALEDVQARVAQDVLQQRQQQQLDQAIEKMVATYTISVTEGA